MAENTKQTPPQVTSLEPTRVSIEDEFQSAEILFREGLTEEAKKKLFHILFSSPHNRAAQELLSRIHKTELEVLLSQRIPTTRPIRSDPEDIEQVIEKLNTDLELGLHSKDFDPDRENWATKVNVSARGHYDLGVAFFEMGCFRDSIRELKSCERKVRIEQTFLGELGVAAVALYSECLILLGQAYDVKSQLPSILNEPDLKHEEKLALFYVMARALESLGERDAARGWFQRVIDVDAEFRDSSARMNKLGQKA